MIYSFEKQHNRKDKVISYSDIDYKAETTSYEQKHFLDARINIYYQTHLLLCCERILGSAQ